MAGAMAFYNNLCCAGAGCPGIIIACDRSFLCGDKSDSFLECGNSCRFIHVTGVRKFRFFYDGSESERYNSHILCYYRFVK
jgi:hypothetical protein